METAVIFAVFTVILIMLYPKDRLRHLVLSETSNYDLTETYLSNMLKVEPNNVELLIPMARIGLQTGKYDLSYKIIEVLHKVRQPHVQALTNRIEMDFWLAKLKVSDSNATTQQYHNAMNALIDRVVQNHAFEKEDAAHWYHDAMELERKSAALTFIEPLYRKDNDRFWLEECLYLATQLQNTNEKNYCVNTLIKRDGNQSEKWLKTAYGFSLEAGKYDDALSLLDTLISLDERYRQERIRVLLLKKDYKAASNMYLFFYRQSDSSKVRETYFIKALSTLQEGNLLDDAVVLAKKYEERFLHNHNISNKMIKLYLAAGRLDEAKRLSLKVLHVKDQK